MMRRLACVALVVLAACGGKAGPRTSTASEPAAARAPEPASNPFLELIPADTPYLYVSTVSTAPYLRAEIASVAPAWRRIAAALERLRRDAPDQNLELPAFQRGVLALVDEIGPELTPEALERLGFDLDGRWAFYGLGLMPVLRLELADGAALEALFARAEARAGIEPRTETVAGRSVRRYPLDSLELILSIGEREAVVALLPRDLLPQLAPALFGDQPLERSVAGAGLIGQVVREFGVPAGLVGYLDFARLIRAASGAGDPAAVAIARALELGSGDSPCVTELAELTRAAPRLVLGGRVTAEGVRGKIVLELAPELARQLAALRAPVPGLDPALSRDAPFAIGLGVDLGALIDLGAGKLAALAQTDYQCQQLAWLPRAAGDLGSSLATARATPLASIRGASAIVRELDLEASSPVGYALAFVGSDQPGVLMSLLGSMAGQSITLRPGDPPARLGQLAGLPGPVHVALAPRALGLSAGAGAEGELTAILARPANPEPPLLLLRVSTDVALAADDEVDEDLAAVAAADPELAAALRELDRQDVARYREMIFTLEAEAKGLALYMDLPFADR